MPETHLHQLIETLKLKMLTMAAHVERAMEHATTSLLERNTELAEQVIEKDSEVNAMENEIDDLSMSILAREQPVARDLRFVIGCMRSVIDLERIGDEAVNIAEKTIFMSQLLEPPHNPMIEELMHTSLSMLHDAIAAFRDGDAAKALDVCRRDNIADELNVRILKRTIDDMVAEATGIRRAVHTILAARCLERVGDLSTNLAESTIFIVQGVSIKHSCQPY
jgi:phosphate transport system protein